MAKSAKIKRPSVSQGSKSVAGTVPCVVPSLFQSCPLASKNSRPLCVRICPNEELVEPGVTSLTSTVPAFVPSLRHNSLPNEDVLALKKRRLLRATKLLGAELPKPGQISLTSTVPPAVPFVTHNSRPINVLFRLLAAGGGDFHWIGAAAAGR